MWCTLDSKRIKKSVFSKEVPIFINNLNKLLALVKKNCDVSHLGTYIKIKYLPSSVQFSRSVVSHSATPWIAARQDSLSITNSWSPPKPMSIKSVMPSNHLILCRALLLLPSIFPSIRVFSNESTLRMRWPKYWSLSFSISPFNEHPGLICFRMDLLGLLAVQGTLNTTVQKHQFFCAQLSSQSNYHIHTWPLEKP